MVSEVTWRYKGLAKCGRRNRAMLWGYGFYKLFLIFLFWGVAGWMIEVIDMRIEAGEFQNRGFLHMPFCPIYGIGMAIASVGLNGVKTPA